VIKSLAIKVPGILAAIAIVAFGHGVGAWLGALAALAACAILLAFIVFNVNSSFWVQTLWCTDDHTGSVALTFDDGPDPESTPLVLEILRAKNVAAAFFVVGESVRAHPDLIARIDADGHLVGNHTDRHGMGFHFKLWTATRREISACNVAIRAAIGREPRLFRSPQGFKNPALGDVLREMGFLAIGWQVRGLDGIEADPNKIVRRIVSHVKPGGVIQMHDGGHARKSRRATLDALPEVIDQIRAAGLEFARLDVLLQVKPYR
jgi:peptidoglycan/xylan/chitin deacetylase (PgdA/CDA1 family)